MKILAIETSCDDFEPSGKKMIFKSYFETPSRKYIEVGRELRATSSIK